ncbi:SDR family NAD(P)-dependent oxidoreductase [Bradyrhizobium sp. 200]|uniref:SDR family NAD(P)-dependent oxidoreductase n=1 Tax=Bradyrhizobium sp. 200 TaxID=2782665 RepID=UPI001FFECB64|nr:SDR family NAD(P)-dependent oxidoreductase [Bradyrhizobium sp. 200]UPJ48324.1 SDR family NAD(P)-dependent oxidoreductase [Bradyrhizobium sp. 200]
MALRGKRILLTGASSGIGRLAAKLLAKAGAVLAVSARREDRLLELVEEIRGDGGVAPHVLPADLSRHGEAIRLGVRALQKLGGIDVLINNAGTTTQALTWIGGDDDDGRAMFEANVWSPLALVASLAPAMVERGEGVIVNVGSMVRVSPFPHLGHYAASRAAVAALSQVMALELNPRGVRVVELDFGTIDTAASHEVRQIAGIQRWMEGGPGVGSLEKAAEALVRAADTRTSGFVFYPGALKWIDRFPGLGRRYSKRLAKYANLKDTAVRSGGSAGDEALRARRVSWETANAQGSQLVASAAAVTLKVGQK